MQHHRVSLPGFGIIVHDAQISEPRQNGEEMESFAEGSLTFEADPKVSLEEPLLAFISKETGKMKSLARSDMDSYLQFGVELINISKPFHLEGIGILQKNSKNQLEFQQTVESIPQDPFKKNQAGSGARKKTITRPAPDTIKKWGLALLVLFIILGIGLAVRWFMNRPITVAEETTTAAIQPSSTTSVTKASNSGIQQTTTTTTQRFGVVLEQSGRQRAFKRFADLKEWGHNVRMVTKDSVTFKLYILINAPLSDTAKHRDSLRVFFNRRVWIETLPDEKP
jgi:hypothetical protein